MAGLGVRRGRLPGASAAGCAGSVQFCEPREDGQSPVPGMTGVPLAPSLGVVENALPSLSITHAYEVSAAGAGSPFSAFGSPVAGAKPFTSPAGGISLHASPVLIIRLRAAAYSRESRAASGTSTNFGSP